MTTARTLPVKAGGVRASRCSLPLPRGGAAGRRPITVPAGRKRPLATAHRRQGQGAAMRPPRRTSLFTEAGDNAS